MSRSVMSSMAALVPCVYVALLLSGCGQSFVPGDFEVPDGFSTQQFKVRPLLASDADMDYEAVMESADLIHASLLSDAWPTSSFTLEEDREQLARKERLFERRRSFTYAVLSPDESAVLGSVYINPGVGGPDAAVFMWVRRSAYERGLDAELERFVRDWIDRDWCFDWVVYPGRDGKAVGTTLASYPVDDAEGLVDREAVELDGEVTRDGGGALRVSTTEPTTIVLYEAGDLDVEDATLLYEADLRCDGLDGRAYLEMWCGFGDEGDFFSKGLDSAVSGTSEWTRCGTPFFLEAGQNPSSVRLELVVDGVGTVWIDDIRLVALRLR